MEAVAADVILLIVFIGDAEDVCLVGHGLVEGGVEHGGHRDLRSEDVAAGLHGDSLGRIVERSKILEGHADIVDDLVGDEGGLLVLFAAVEDAVSDSRDLVDVGENGKLAGGQAGDQFLKGVLMGGERLVLLYGAAVGDLVGDNTVHADTFNVSLGDNRLVGHVDELILEGGATCIDYQNFHVSTIPYIFILFQLTAQHTKPRAIP